MSKTYTDLRRAIDSDQLPRLIFLQYEEAYLARQLERRLKASLIQESAEVLDYLEMDSDQAASLTLDRLNELCQAPPFISEHKLILFKDSGLFSAGRNNQSGPAFRPEVKADWLKTLENLPASLCLVFRERKIDRRQRSFWQSLEKAGAWIVEVKRPDEASLFQWLAALAKQSSLGLSRAAAEELCQRCDLEMDVLHGELQKLSSIALARGLKGIDLDLVKEAARPNLNADIFQLLDQLAKGNSFAAFKLKKRLLERKEPLQLIQFMLARKLRQLLIAKEIRDSATLATRLKLPAFVARKLLAESREFKTEDLERQYRALFLSDWQVKQGNLADDLAFDLAILELAGLKQ